MLTILNNGRDTSPRDSGRSVLRDAVRPVVETLENRQFFAATVGSGSDPLASTPDVVVTQPSVRSVTPAAGTTNVKRDAFVAADLNLPAGGIDAATLNATTVTVTRNRDGATVALDLNTTGGGDAIVARPLALLDANTAYTFSVTAGLTDTAGNPFVPFSTTFTTGTATTASDPALKFKKVALANVPSKQYTAVTKGPDGKLYAASVDGVIYRFGINADGTLAAPQAITSLQTANGGNRFLVGLEFDPNSTANNLILWTTHAHYAFDNAQDWTGRVTRLSGANLDTVQDVVTGLPRSSRDHVTNQIKFGPDGALYISQGSMTAMGAPDTTWANRPERLLSAAILRLDTTKVTPGSPVNVRTEGNTAGNYNPYAANAPLTIYATGVRNAYDLVWASNGQLYTAVNGSAAGGNTPASPAGVTPAVPGLTNVAQTENDYLQRIVPGGYYGHPNPARGQYVLNGGNPTSGVDVAEFTAYPVGTQPGAGWVKPAYDFGAHYSPDGMIQYKGGAFGGALRDKLLVARYSGGDDIIALTIGADGNIVDAKAGIAGLTGFTDPVDLIEDPVTGFLYVAEYGGRTITLVKPVDPNIAADRARLLFNDPAGGSASATQTVYVRNTGTTALTIAAGGISLAGADAGQFQLSLPTTSAIVIQPGGAVPVGVAFNPSASAAAGLKTATLRFSSDDNDQSQFDVTLRALATTGVGGANEPSLQRILDLYGIPVTVGDADPATTELYAPGGAPLASSQEVAMQRMVKAGAGPVTIEPLAMMGVSSTPAMRLGYYLAGGQNLRAQTFSVGAADAQSVNPTPNGSTSFEPYGNVFGIYSEWPGFTGADGATARVSYSEDALNTWEPSLADRRKVRFYPLKNADGSVVPNAYVMAHEEYTQYDSNDFVAIVRNVAPASAVAGLSLENLDGAPFNDWLSFNRIQTPNPTIPNVVHDTATLRLRNTGTGDLRVTALTFSSGAPWQIVNAPALPLTIAPGASRDLTIKFTATSGGLRTGTLTVSTNDPLNQTKVVQLRGHWQAQSENNMEPLLPQLASLFGYGTTITAAGQNLNNAGKLMAVGDEILSDHWAAADPAQAVTVRQLAAYHGQGNDATFRWFAKGTWDLAPVVTVHGASAQSVLPLGYGNAPAAGSFTPGTTVFGFQIDGESSDHTRNTQEQPGGNYGHHVRFWPAKDRFGVVIPNAYLVGMDYSGINYDFQDNLYLVTNVRPEMLPGVPSGLTATAGPSGTMLAWTPNAGGGGGGGATVGYNVYRGTSATGTFAKLNGAAPLTVPVYTDLTGTAGVTYHYRVTAVNAAGAETLPATASAATQPRVNAVLSAANAAGGKVALTWTPGAGATGYRVERSLSAVSGWVEIASVGADVLTLLDAGVAGDTTYYYRVRTAVSAGGSLPSNVVAVTTPAANPLPASWSRGDVGAVGLAGSATHDDGAYTVIGSGGDIYGSADAFQFAYQTLTGDATLVARVTGVQNTHKNAKAGLMIRQSLDAGAANAMVEISGGGGAEFHWRSSAGGQTDFAAAPGPTAPYWLKLVRAGDVMTAYTSADGVAWTQAGSATVAMSGTVFVGLAVCSHDDAVLNTSTFDNVSITTGPVAPPPPPAGALPSGWSQGDVGYPAKTGGATYAGGVYTVTGAGADIYGTWDGFQFAYKALNGDGTIVARVTGVQNTHKNAKAGLMIRQSLEGGSANAMIELSGGGGAEFHYRTTAGGQTDYAVLPNASAPTWLKLVRAGDTVTGYTSADGVTWTPAGSATVAMSGTVYVGLAVCSHDDAVLNTSTFDNVSVTTPAPANAAPTVATAAAASSATVTGKTTALVVLGADDAGEAGLTYAWAVVGQPPAPVTFAANGTNAAKNVTATFDRAGTYTLRATITDAAGMTATSDVTVIVAQTLTAITVTPGTAALAAGGQQPFSALAKDQFGDALAAQPAFTWTATGGTVSATGLYTAGAAGGSYAVTATSGGVASSASITVTAAANAAPTVAAAAKATPATVTGKTTALTVLGADDGGEANLTYTWATTGNPPAGVTFGVNGSNAAKNATATFAKAGTYALVVTISDGTKSVTSTVNVTVAQTFTSVAVSPASPTVNNGKTQPFAAAGLDQFGNAMATAPKFAWSLVAGGVGGTVNATTGLYTAPANGTGSVTVRATSGAVSGAATVSVQQQAIAPVKVNFQLASAAPVAGYLVDGGAVYGSRGNGQTYGWNVSHADVSRDRNLLSDQLLDTLIHFKSNAKWEVAVPNGSYNVKVGIGDAQNASTHTLNVEGVSAFANLALGANVFRNKVVTVNVTDGRLTLNQGTAANMATRINYVEITSNAPAATLAAVPSGGTSTTTTSTSSGQGAGGTVDGLFNGTTTINGVGI